MTASGEQQDLGTEVSWAKRGMGTVGSPCRHTRMGRRRSGSPALPGARCCLGLLRNGCTGEKSGMVLLLLQGSTGLEFKDEWVFSAAVTFIKVKSGWPQSSADTGGARSPQTQSGSLNRALHKGSSHIPAMHRTPFAVPLASLCPCTPALPRSTPLHPAASKPPAPTPGGADGFRGADCHHHPAKPTQALGGQTQAGHPLA